MARNINGQPFTCSSGRFETNIDRGKSHGKHDARGSVFGTAIDEQDGDTLWLEYVHDSRGPDVLWLMWYDENGNPKTGGSSIIAIEKLKEMVRRLSDFTEII